MLTYPPCEVASKTTSALTLTRPGGGIKAVGPVCQEQVHNTSLINKLPEDGGAYIISLQK